MPGSGQISDDSRNYSAERVAKNWVEHSRKTTNWKLFFGRKLEVLPKDSVFRKIGFIRNAIATSAAYDERERDFRDRFVKRLRERVDLDKGGEGEKYFLKIMEKRVEDELPLRRRVGEKKLTDIIAQVDQIEKRVRVSVGSGAIESDDGEVENEAIQLNQGVGTQVPLMVKVPEVVESIQTYKFELSEANQMERQKEQVPHKWLGGSADENSRSFELCDANSENEVAKSPKNTSAEAAEDSSDWDLSSSNSRSRSNEKAKKKAEAQAKAKAKAKVQHQKLNAWMVDIEKLYATWNEKKLCNQFMEEGDLSRALVLIASLEEFNQRDDLAKLAKSRSDKMLGAWVEVLEGEIRRLVNIGLTPGSFGYYFKMLTDLPGRINEMSEEARERFKSAGDAVINTLRERVRHENHRQDDLSTVNLMIGLHAAVGLDYSVEDVCVVWKHALKKSKAASEADIELAFAALLGQPQGEERVNQDLLKQMKRDWDESRNSLFHVAFRSQPIARRFEELLRAPEQVYASKPEAPEQSPSLPAALTQLSEAYGALREEMKPWASDDNGAKAVLSRMRRQILDIHQAQQLVENEQDPPRLAELLKGIASEARNFAGSVPEALPGYTELHSAVARFLAAQAPWEKGAPGAGVHGDKRTVTGLAE